MDGKSLSITEEKIKELKKIFPEIVSEDRIDFDRLKNILGQEVKDKDERYTLSWAGKSNAYKTLQQLSSSTLVPDKDQSVDFDTTENIFIEGENLEVLKVLQRSYFGKIKMIYIDPPYNTGKDSFIYPDKFFESKKNYQQRAGIKDEDGNLLKEGSFNLNSKENGQYHSNWLSMMMPRLFLAKNLLKQDGVIFVSIDDNEVHNLRLLMNEIFGEENFIGMMSRQQSSGSKNDTDSDKIISSVDYVLCYSKGKFNFRPYLVKNTKSYNCKDEKGYFSPRVLEKQGGGDTLKQRPKMGYSIYYNKDQNEVKLLYDYDLNNDPIYEKPNEQLLSKGYECFRPQKRGEMEMGIWRWGSDKFMKEFEDDEVYFSNGRVFSKDRAKENLEKYPEAFLEGYLNTQGTNDIKELFKQRVFDFSKPTDLLKYFFSITTDEDDIILDFFAGSGTTGHAVMKLNSDEDEGKRKFILVQLSEEVNPKHEAYTLGYKTIADICKERLRRAGKQVKQELTAQNVDTGFKAFKLQGSNFKQWREVDNEEDLVKQLEIFVDNIKDDTVKERNIVYEILLKKGYSLNSKIEQTDNIYKIEDTMSDKKMLLLLSGKIEKQVIEKIIESGVKDIVVLDKLFEDDDCLKQNMYLRMKDNDINFESI